MSQFRQTATPWMRPGRAVRDSPSPYYLSPSPYYLAWPPQRKRLSSSVCWRPVRPPSVFECAMPQSARIRPALTEPIFGSAKRTSRTLAVRRHSGGRLGEDLRQFDLSRREILLQLRSRRPYLVGQPQGTQTLLTRSARNTRICLAGRHMGDFRDRTRWAVKPYRLEMGFAMSAPVAFWWKGDVASGDGPRSENSG